MEQYNLRLAEESDIPSILPLYKVDTTYQLINKLPISEYSIETLVEYLKTEISIQKDTHGFFVLENPLREIVASCRVYFSFHRNGYHFLQFNYKPQIEEAEANKLLRISLDLCFNELNYHKVNVEIRSTQIDAFKIYFQCGFKEEVVLREHFYHEGKYEDILHLGLIREDYINNVVYPVNKEHAFLSIDEDYKLKPNILPTKPLLQGEKINLGIISEEDIELITHTDVISDEKYSASIFAVGPTSKKFFKKSVCTDNNYRTLQPGLLFGIKKKDGSLVGTISAQFVDNRNRNLMIGISIYNTTDRGSGYGSESINLLLDYAFLEMNMHRVYLGCFGFNSQAAKLYQKLGFKPEGINRSFVYRNGNYYDEISFGILKSEWLRLRGYIN